MIGRMYEEGNTFLHRLNPTMKLVVFTFFVIVPTLFFDPATPAAFLLLALVLGWLLGGVSPVTLGRRLAPLVIIAAGLTIFNTLTYGGERSHLLAALGPLQVHTEALSFGASIGLRILCVAAFSALFAYTTDPSVLVSSLIHQARLPYRLGYTILAAYRFLPILQRELANIRDAHSVRGAYSQRDPLASLRRARRYGVPLLANGIRQAERLAIAMDARGFGTQAARTYYIQPRLLPADYLFALASLLTVTVLLLILSRFDLLRGFLGGIAESVH